MVTFHAPPPRGFRGGLAEHAEIVEVGIADNRRAATAAGTTATARTTATATRLRFATRGLTPAGLTASRRAATAATRRVQPGAVTTALMHRDHRRLRALARASS